MSWFKRARRSDNPRSGPPSGVTEVALRDGRQVKYLDSRLIPGGEMGAMDILEGTGWSALLRTSEGNFIPWVGGHTCGWARTLDDAATQLSERLRQRGD